MWPVTASRTAYENRWITVTEDTVEMRDGSPGLYGVVTVRHTSVFVVALTEADEVVLVRLDRHTTGEGVEVPAGGTDGQDPLVAAQRELEEESGYRAATWREIGRMNALNGICRAPEVVFLATDLSRVEAHGAHEEGISAVRAVPWRRVMGYVRDGTISDGETVAALMYAALALGKL
jgi:8-oxo-dGTP pyrophosphatase MutT (NUDIX family)